jgi:nicotinamidase-related amidase
MRQALIIVDMQRGSFTAASPRHDAEGLVGRLNALSARVRRAGGLVVFVQHEGPEGDLHHPDQPGFRLLAGLEVANEDLVVRKTACDAFLGTRLAAVLEAASVGDLIITGCATDYCVDTTVRSALARSYRTTVPRDGHTTADRPHLTARQIIEHHNAIWSDFLSPVGPATVCACGEIAVEMNPTAPSKPPDCEPTRVE